MQLPLASGLWLSQVMLDLTNEVINEKEAILQAINLIAGHRDLIQGFSKFLPGQIIEVEEAADEEDEGLSSAERENDNVEREKVMSLDEAEANEQMKTKARAKEREAEAEEQVEKGAEKFVEWVSNKPVTKNFETADEGEYGKEEERGLAGFSSLIGQLRTPLTELGRRAITRDLCSTVSSRFLNRSVVLR